MKVLHLINDLSLGGAQIQHQRYVAASTSDIEHFTLTFVPPTDSYSPQTSNVFFIPLENPSDYLLFLIRLRKLLISIQPDAILSWLLQSHILY